jgi:hypothetical protein
VFLACSGLYSGIDDCFDKAIVDSLFRKPSSIKERANGRGNQIGGGPV